VNGGDGSKGYLRVGAQLDSKDVVGLGRDHGLGEMADALTTLDLLEKTSSHGLCRLINSAT